MNPNITANTSSQLEVNLTLIKVRIFDKVTNNPIEGAFVEYVPAPNGTYVSGSTNAQGRFNPGSCDPGFYNVTVSMPGYKTHIQLVTLATDESKFFNIYLERDTEGPSVFGFIEVYVNSSGIQISGATVQCVNSSGIIRTGSTDGTGFYNITGLDAGIYSVTVSKTGYFQQSKGAILYYLGDNETVEFDLIATPSSPGWIEVTVRDNESTPLEGALVEVRNATSHILIVSGYTDVNGFFNVTGLGVGWYNVTASKGGYIPETQDDYINGPGDEDTLFFYLMPYGPTSAFIEVTVKDGDTDNLMINALVRIVHIDSGSEISTGLTDVNGQHNATDLETGWYDIYVNASGYGSTRVSDQIEFNGEGDRLIIYLAPADTFTLTVIVHVKDADNTLLLISNALVVWKQNPKALTWSTIAEYNTFNMGYASSANIANTTTLIEVSRAGYNGSSQIFDFSGINAPATVNVDIFMKSNAPGSGVIHVNVEDVLTKVPLENANATLMFTNRTVITSKITPSTGYVNFTGLIKGTYIVNVTRDFYFSKEKSTLIDVDGDEDTLDFQLVRVDFISLRLILNPITPNPDPTGDIDLKWNYIGLALYYEIYRGSQAGNLSFYKNVTDISQITYKDAGVVGFYYYYQIRAYNGTHMIISNVESVAVYKGGIPLHPGWILICIGAVASGALAMYIVIIDEMRRDYNRMSKGEPKKGKGGKK